MIKTKFLLILTIVWLSLVLQTSHSYTEDIPFGINNPYDESAPKEKAYFIKLYMNDLGIKWVNANVFRKRVEPKPGVYDWKEVDFLVNDVFKGFDLVLNINPKTSWQAKGSIKVDKKSYIPAGNIDSESYKLYIAFLKELIKQYKNRVHRWEIFNEPGLEYNKIPEEYVKLLKISYVTIKEVDQNAIVCLGGQMATPHSLNFLKKTLPLLSSEHPVFGKDNAKHNNYFNSFDLHYFSFFDEYQYHHPKRKKIVTIDEFLNLFKKYGLFSGKMITARAGGTYTGEDLKTDFNGRPLKYQSEAQQSSYLIKRAIYLLSREIRSAWSQIREREKWQGNPNHFWCYQGLVYNGVPKGDKYDKGDGVKKLSFWTYKFLVEKMKETEWKNILTIHEGTGSDNLYLYKIPKKDGKPLYIAWWDYFDEKKPPKTKTITIDMRNVNSVRITETVPDAEWGYKLKDSDYPEFFKTVLKKVNNGKVSIELGEKPVFVEVEGK